VADELPDVYLRFLDKGNAPRIKGDSLDEAYPGKEGWLGITKFNFGFGWGGSEAVGPSQKLTDKVLAGKATEKEKNEFKKQQQQTQVPKPETKQDSTLKPDDFSFSRNCSPATIPLIEILRNGDEIEKVEVVVCRAAAAATPTKPKDAKIPFLQLLFEHVHLKQCDLSTARDDPASEDMKFKFKVVRLTTIWTDNATGKQEPGGELRISFDFGTTKGNVSWAGDF
jgi:type VI protein secretion system component Hcp